MKQKPTITNELYRQGDVLMRAIPEESLNARTLETSGPIILASGEITGHHHAIAGTSAVSLLEDDQGSRYLRVREPAQVRHPEHAPIELPPGAYEVIRQREYSPRLDLKARYVAD